MDSEWTDGGDGTGNRVSLGSKSQTRHKRKATLWRGGHLQATEEGPYGLCRVQALGGKVAPVPVKEPLHERPLSRTSGPGPKHACFLPPPLSTVQWSLRFGQASKPHPIPRTHASWRRFTTRYPYLPRTRLGDLGVWWHAVAWQLICDLSADLQASLVPWIDKHRLFLFSFPSRVPCPDLIWQCLIADAIRPTPGYAWPQRRKHEVERSSESCLVEAISSRSKDRVRP